MAPMWCVMILRSGKRSKYPANKMRAMATEVSYGHPNTHHNSYFDFLYVIWCSILGVLPFTLALPYANLFWTEILTVIIGLVLASAFSAILVDAQDLLPGRVGMVSGLFFGLAFGMGGVGAALLGRLADARGIEYVYRVCAFLPAIGLLTAFLPTLHAGGRSNRKGLTV